MYIHHHSCLNFHRSPKQNCYYSACMVTMSDSRLLCLKGNRGTHLHSQYRVLSLHGNSSFMGSCGQNSSGLTVLQTRVIVPISVLLTLADNGPTLPAFIQEATFPRTVFDKLFSSSSNLPGLTRFLFSLPRTWLWFQPLPQASCQ